MRGRRAAGRARRTRGPTSWRCRSGSSSRCISIFLGGGAIVFAGIFLAVGIGSLAAGIWGDNEETQTFALIFGGAFTLFGLLPLVGGLALRPMAKAKLEKAQKLVASGGRGIGTVVEVSDTGITINDNPRVHLRMRVEPTDGSAPFEREKTITVSRVAIPRAGDRFPVFYDRDDPSNWGYGTEMEADAPADIRALFAEAAAGPGGRVRDADPVAPAGASPSPIDEIARLNDLRLKGQSPMRSSRRPRTGSSLNWATEPRTSD